MGPKPFLGQLKKAFLVSVLLTTKSVTTSEVFHSGKLSALEIARLGRQVDKSLLELYGCMNQSCLIADTSGSTGRVPFMKAEGATDADIACIVAHNQEIGELLKAYDNNPPLGPKQPLTVISSFLSGVNGLGRPIVAASGSTETGTYDGSCASNILLFAKGTFEFGAYGITIGPELIRSLPSDWTAGGINYDSDIQGTYCLGLPGGRVATAVINDAARKCPTSNLYLSGYSQGAMVIRNGIARAEKSAVARIKGVVTFGDPFNGAGILGYNGPLKIFCTESDGVCGGNFEVRPAHLAYILDGTVQQGLQELINMSHGGGDRSCCKRPDEVLVPPSPDQWKQTLKANGGVSPLPAVGTSVEVWAAAIANSGGGIPKGTVNTPGRSRRTAVMSSRDQ